ncbi:MAG: hypothetical protein PHW50_03395 [Patescibacteria group bacterium]|nr:hypothetical protein [Patescibacteria group bacterium]
MPEGFPHNPKEEKAISNEVQIQKLVDIFVQKSGRSIDNNSYHIHRYRDIAKFIIDSFRKIEALELPELPEEVLNLVLQKTEDIKQPGVAAHGTFIAKENGIINFEQILSHGILGDQDHHLGNHYETDFEKRKRKWAESARNRDALNSQIFFNIAPLKGDPFLPPAYIGGGSVGILFNMDDFHELPGATFSHLSRTREDREKFQREYQQIFDKKFRPKKRQYSTNIYATPLDAKQTFALKSGRKLAISGYETHPDMGFITPYRISPRQFEGIVLGSDFKPEELQQIIHAMQRAYAEKPELLVPIYDIGGNMIWPKKMFYLDLLEYVKDKPSKMESSQAITDFYLNDVAKKEFSVEELIQLLDSILQVAQKTNQPLKHIPEDIKTLIPDYINQDIVQQRIFGLIVRDDWTSLAKLEVIDKLLLRKDLTRNYLETNPQILEKFLKDIYIEKGYSGYTENIYLSKNSILNIPKLSEVFGLDQTYIEQIVYSDKFYYDVLQELIDDYSPDSWNKLNLFIDVYQISAEKIAHWFLPRILYILSQNRYIGNINIDRLIPKSLRENKEVQNQFLHLVLEGIREGSIWPGSTPNCSKNFNLNTHTIVNSPEFIEAIHSYFDHENESEPEPIYDYNPANNMAQLKDEIPEIDWDLEILKTWREQKLGRKLSI